MTLMVNQRKKAEARSKGGAEDQMMEAEKGGALHGAHGKFVNMPWMVMVTVSLLSNQSSSDQGHR